MALSKIPENHETYETIGPDRARALLDSIRPDQRRINEEKILRLMAIARGETGETWVATPATPAILIDRNGCLAGGQHRMTVVVRTGIPLRFRVIYGASDQDIRLSWGGKGENWSAAEQCIQLTDGLIKRSVANRVVAVVGAAIRWCWAFNGHPSPVEMASAYSALRASLEWWEPYLTSPLFGHQAVGFTFVLAHHVGDARSRERLDQFVHNVKTGSDLRTGDPALTLRDYLQCRQNRRARKAEGLREISQRVATAISAMQSGQKISRIRLQSVDLQPLLGPRAAMARALGVRQIAPRVTGKRKIVNQED